MNKLTANDMAPALKEIGHDLSGIPSYRIEDGRILISILDNEEGEGEETIEELRRNLPEGAAAEWTGNSDTSGDGEVTRDCEITWANSDFENEICIEMQDGNDFEYFPNGSLYGGTKRMFSFKGVLLATDTTKTQGNSDEDPGFPFGLEWEDDWKNRVAAAWRPLDEKEIQMIEQCVADNRLPGEGATEKELLETYGGPDDEDELGRPYWLLCSAPCREFEYRIALEDGKGIDVS